MTYRTYSGNTLNSNGNQVVEGSLYFPKLYGNPSIDLHHFPEGAILGVRSQETLRNPKLRPFLERAIAVVTPAKNIPESIADIVKEKKMIVVGGLQLENLPEMAHTVSLPVRVNAKGEMEIISYGSECCK